MKNILAFLISISIYTSVSYADDNKENVFGPQNKFENTNIERSSDIFKIHTGADITDYGQPGLPRYISLLGLSNSHTPITLDGRNIGIFQNGNRNLNRIPARLVNNIEVKKGINSALDGPDVLGGIVNIITPEPYNEVPYTCLYSRWGSSGLENYGLNFKNQNGSLRYSIFADKLFSRGFGFYKRYIKYNAVNFYSKMDWFYDPDTWVTVTAGKYADNVESPSLTGLGSEKNDNKHFQMKYETHQPKTAFKIRFYGSQDWRQDNTNINIFENFTQGNEEIIEQNLGKYHLIRLGKDHHWNKFNGNITQNSYSDISNKEDALFYEDEIDINSLKIIIGQRRDKNSMFKTEKSPRLRMDYRFDDKTKMFLSAGQGISFPKVNDLYLQDAYYKGNPDLITEKGWVYTLGYEKIFSDILSVNLSGHFADVSNFILWKYDSTAGYSRAENASSVTSKGAETGIKFALNEKLDIQTVYTYLLTEDREIKKALPYRPGSKIRTDLSYKMKKYNGDLLWIIALSHEYVGSRYSDRDNSRMLNYYDAANLNISMVLAKAFTINAAVNNLGNNKYSLVENYPMPRRHYWGGIVWEFLD